MKTAMIAMALLLSLCVRAQTPTAASQPPAAPPDINTVLGDLQRIATATNGDLNKLRIDKWKTETSEKQQMQQVAESLQRNIASAIPGLITEVQSSQGSVSKTFKLYHNINVVYEFLNSLAEAAGAFGKKEEYEPLATDANALDSVRQNLSSYIEQAANTMESRTRPGTTAAQNSQSTQKGPKKIVIDDTAPTTTKKKGTRKKTAPPQ
ncbi:MAG: hypothetical protein DMG65_17810 [Candidatus Angelobacter sp. Gp1-AA117]|nr:MAG: hypothetical protein DMG65_17810 [Candidatus Angelobacter sp. Gp1-AA117]